MKSLQNPATLQRLGFQPLGNGFYFKRGIFLVKLDRAGQVISISSPLGLNGTEHQEEDTAFRARYGFTKATLLIGWIPRAIIETFQLRPR